MDNFQQVIGRLVLAHAEVKAIDRKVLSERRRKQRAQQMGELRRAIDEIVLLKFDQLATAAKTNAQALDQATEDLSSALASIKTAIGVLDTIGAALGAITSLVGLLRGG